MMDINFTSKQSTNYNAFRALGFHWAVAQALTCGEYIVLANYPPHKFY